LRFNLYLPFNRTSSMMDLNFTVRVKEGEWCRLKIKICTTRTRTKQRYITCTWLTKVVLFLKVHMTDLSSDN
jgi:hypothetical protein